jgi:hypothetical protein
MMSNQKRIERPIIWGKLNPTLAWSTLKSLSDTGQLTPEDCDGCKKTLQNTLLNLMDGIIDSPEDFDIQDLENKINKTEAYKLTLMDMSFSPPKRKETNIADWVVSGKNKNNQKDNNKWIDWIEDDARSESPPPHWDFPKSEPSEFGVQFWDEVTIKNKSEYWAEYTEELPIEKQETPKIENSLSLLEAVEESFNENLLPANEDNIPSVDNSEYWTQYQHDMSQEGSIPTKIAPHPNVPRVEPLVIPPPQEITRVKPPEVPTDISQCRKCGNTDLFTSSGKTFNNWCFICTKNN